MNKILLSIVYPTFEREETIEISIKSMLANIPIDIQDLVEILIIDNFSQDSTPEIVNKLINENKWLTNFKLIRNDQNVGYDLNHYLAYTTSQGKFIWFCSDRYIYNVNVKTIVSIIKNNQNINTITFSDLFRIKNCISNKPMDVNSIDKMFEVDNFTDFNAVLSDYNKTRCYQISNQDMINNGVHRLKGVILTANVSDSIVRIYQDENWLTRLKSYDGTFMLVVAALLKPYSYMNDYCAVINLPFFTKSFHRIDIKGSRHPNKKVSYGNLMLQEDFPFIDKKAILIMFQINVLSNLIISNITGKNNSINTLKVEDILTFCDDHNFRCPFILKQWLFLLKISYFPKLSVKPLHFINKVIFKLYEIIRFNKK